MLRRYAEVPLTYVRGRGSPPYLVQGCAACKQPWLPGQRIRIDERSGIYSQRRYTTYHIDCTPEAIDRQVARIVAHHRASPL